MKRSTYRILVHWNSVMLYQKVTENVSSIQGLQITELQNKRWDIVTIIQKKNMVL